MILNNEIFVLGSILRMVANSREDAIIVITITIEQ
jgi:hypothetical protein